MKLQKLVKKARLEFLSWQSESYFAAAPMPSVLSPLAAVHGSLETLKGLKFDSRMAKRTAVTACETARQACKHVDVATKTNNTAGWQPMSAPAPTQVPWYDKLDKDELMAVMAAGQRPTAEIQRDLEAAVAAARANRAVYGS